MTPGVLFLGFLQIERAQVRVESFLTTKRSAEKKNKIKTPFYVVALSEPTVFTSLARFPFLLLQDGRGHPATLRLSLPSGWNYKFVPISPARMTAFLYYFSVT